MKKGEQLTLALEMVRDKIMHRDIPKQWRKFAPETSKSLARWFEQLQASILFIFNSNIVHCLP